MRFYPNSDGSSRNKSLREFNPCHDAETGEFCQTVGASDLYGQVAKGALVHGSPRTLHDLQPGSMISDDPTWAAGYTTKLDAIGVGETFVGKIHLAALPTGKVAYASGVHEAEDLLIQMAKRLPDYTPSMRLKQLAEIVHKATGIEAIVARNSKGQIKGGIVLIPVKVTGHADPAEALRHAKKTGRPIPSNLDTALKRGLREMNTCHDPESGEFCSGPSYMDGFGNRQYNIDQGFSNRESTDSVFRGITAEEAHSIRRTGKIQSTGAFSHSSEGTSFGHDFGTAESAVNFGRTNPAKTGKPNYVIEVEHGKDIVVDRRDGFPKAKAAIPASRIRRVWVFHPDGRVEVRRAL